MFCILQIKDQQLFERFNNELRVTGGLKDPIIIGPFGPFSDRDGLREFLSWHPSLQVVEATIWWNHNVVKENVTKDDYSKAY